MWLNYKEWLKNLVMVLFLELYRTHLLRIKYLNDITSFTVSVILTYDIGGKIQRWINKEPVSDDDNVTKQQVLMTSPSGVDIRHGRIDDDSVGDVRHRRIDEDITPVGDVRHGRIDEDITLVGDVRHGRIYEDITPVGDVKHGRIEIELT